MPFPLEDCSVFGNFVITLIYGEIVADMELRTWKHIIVHNEQHEHTYLKPRSNSRDTDSIGHTPEQRQTEHKTQETNKMSNTVPTKTPGMNLDAREG